MNPEELRIGNYVHSTKSVKGLFMPDGVARVLTLGMFQIRWLRPDQIPAQIETWNVANYYEIEPIPITSEWLQRFGFKKKSEITWSFGYEKQYSVYTLGSFTYNQIQAAWWYHGVLEKQPEHVHQLQNLYFALTGEELQLTSEKQAAD